MSNERITSILSQIDHDADAGACSNWAEYNVTYDGRLIVTLADGTVEVYR